MSVGGEIKKLKEYLRDGRRSIVARGGDISTSAGLRDFPSSIYNIPADNAISTVTQNQVARFVPVPENSTGYGYLAEFGGMTYKCKQLIPYPYFNSDKTIDGVTYIVGKDGGISVSGVAGEFAQFVLAESVAVYPTTYTMRLYGKYSNIQGTVTIYDESGAKLIDYQIKTSAVTIDLTSYPTARSARIYLKRTTSGVEATGTIYPMFNLGNTEAPYELYYEGLRDTKPTEIVSKGANIIPYPFHFKTYTKNGVTFTANDDQSITVSGTPTTTSSAQIITDGTHIPVKQGDVFTLSNSAGWASSIGYVYVTIKDEKLTTLQNAYAYATAKTFTVVADGYLTLGVVTIQGNEFNDTIRVMLSRGAEVAPYKPYIGTITTRAIPEAIRALEGYGKGVSLDYYNKVDLVNKKYAKQCYRVVLDGVNNRFTYTHTQSGYRYFQTVLDKTSVTNQVVCSHLEYGRVYQSGYCYTLPTQKVLICFLEDQTITSVDAANEWLKQQYEAGTPFEFIYPSAEVEEIDLPTTIEPIIEVEGGGSLQFVNEYDYGVPSKSVYQVKAE